MPENSLLEGRAAPATSNRNRRRDHLGIYGEIISVRPGDFIGISIERIDDAIFGIDYPFLLEVKGRCPPEDIGGAPGYENFLAALANPEHENHAEMLEWALIDFDPHHVDEEARQRAVEQLAKRWKPKPRTPRIPKK